jgi:hypothetical protein
MAASDIFRTLRNRALLGGTLGFGGSIAAQYMGGPYHSSEGPNGERTSRSMRIDFGKALQMAGFGAAGGVALRAFGKTGRSEIASAIGIGYKQLGELSKTRKAKLAFAGAMAAASGIGDFYDQKTQGFGRYDASRSLFAAVKGGLGGYGLAFGGGGWKSKAIGMAIGGFTGFSKSNTQWLGGIQGALLGGAFGSYTGSYYNQLMR